MYGAKRGLDPRIGIGVILLSVVIVFAHPKLYVEWIFMASILLLMWWFGIRRTMLQIIYSYLFLCTIQMLVIPNVNLTIASMISVAVYFKMIFPCGAAVALFCGTTPVRVLLEAFRRMHVPLSVSVAVAVSARYFPTLKDELTAIWGAMRLRGIKGVEQKIEGMYVPLLMSAVKTGEELAQSAVVRGIENPAPKTSIVEIRIGFGDVLVLLYFLLLAAVAVMVR